MTPAHTRSFPSPIVLGLIGLALMVGGWKASTYLPEGSRQAEQARQAEEVRRLADKELRDKIDQYGRTAKPPAPYELPGRLAFFGGLILFIAAGVQMYRQPPPPEEDKAEQEAEADVPTPRSP
jgi:hypothetical protein